MESGPSPVVPKPSSTNAVERTEVFRVPKGPDVHQQLRRLKDRHESPHIVRCLLFPSCKHDNWPRNLENGQPCLDHFVSNFYNTSRVNELSSGSLQAID